MGSRNLRQQLAEQFAVAKAPTQPEFLSVSERPQASQESAPFGPAVSLESSSAPLLPHELSDFPKSPPPILSPIETSGVDSDAAALVVFFILAAEAAKAATVTPGGDVLEG